MPEKGLSEGEVIARQKFFGPNEIPQEIKRQYLANFLAIIKEPIFLMIFTAFSLYILIGDTRDAFALLFFITLSIAITHYQKNKSDQALHALRSMAIDHCECLRQGKKIILPTRELVPGDIIILREGQRLPADAVLLPSEHIYIDESIATGESEPVYKSHAQERGQGLDSTLLLGGSLVTRGIALARVSATGTNTALGKIGQSLKKIQTGKSPLQIKLEKISYQFAYLAIAISSLVILVYGLYYERWLYGAMTGISLAIAILPEEFIIIFSIFIALGAYRMAQEHVLLRHTPAIETLGSVSVLCLDKTGTLTENCMTIIALADSLGIHVLEDASFQVTAEIEELISYAALASEVHPQDPLEVAIHRSTPILHADHSTHYENQTVAWQLPFSHQLPMMANLWASHDPNAHHLIAIKGSPETVMDLCKLDESRKKIIENQMAQLGQLGLRMIGVAKSRAKQPKEEENLCLAETPCQWLGLIGFQDPLREGVVGTIQDCQAAGIHVVMITGDHLATARTIADQAGIAQGGQLSGTELNQLSSSDLLGICKKTSIYYRISPEQKLRIIQAYQAAGEVVAMIGDGVNDAPALKAAHIGIAMGLKGTDVAKEAASMVLLDDRLSSLFKAITQGRLIYENLRKAGSYVTAIHIPIAGAVLMSTLTGQNTLLEPVHILFLQMIIDPACAFVYETETAEKDLMHREPRNINEAFMSASFLTLSIFQGIGLWFAIIIVFGIHLYRPDLMNSSEVTGMIFISLALGSMALMISKRSNQQSLWQILKNPSKAQTWLLVCMSLSLILIIQFDFLREEFKFSLLNTHQAILIALVSIATLGWFEWVKYLYRKRIG